jgi:hypothetical protein
MDAANGMPRGGLDKTRDKPERRIGRNGAGRMRTRVGTGPAEGPTERNCSAV